MTSLKTSIKTITYLSDIGCLEIQGASLTSKAGIYQPYYKINLSKARISSIDFVTPHAVLEKELEPQERIAFIYEDISWEHTLAGTNAMSKWQDRVQ